LPHFIISGSGGTVIARRLVLVLQALRAAIPCLQQSINPDKRNERRDATY
jgi:hypothetical protein